MHWLLEQKQQEQIRKKIDDLVQVLSVITDNPHNDQLFPYVGRKDRRKALAVVKVLTNENELIVDPFAGSGTFVYASYQSNRKCLANEWEPYTCRMANAPWRLPSKENIDLALNQLLKVIKKDFDYLYQTICPCGYVHVLDTLFFDRIPLKFKNVTSHERLGKNGENITYRTKYKCPKCGRTEKYFDESDEKHIRKVMGIKIPKKYLEIFNSPLIENSRINLSSELKYYRLLFPHRSIIALCKLWDGISTLECDNSTKLFLEDTFLSILPQAKYKDYRSKSQDLHLPREKLREVNILYRFIDQIEIRYNGLNNYSFSSNQSHLPISCRDFRDFMSEIASESVNLIFTDPPWTDGNAYFEKAQLYHPWLGYCLLKDKDRLEKEVVVTDAPSRKNEHDVKRWWIDISKFFYESYRVLYPLRYAALFFRPIPSSKWLTNLNKLKLVARKAGFEPLLSIDVSNSDPSMRIQQSASYVFSQDIVLLFVKLPENVRRFYYDDFDIDQIIFQTAEELQENKFGPFSYTEWRDNIAVSFVKKDIGQLNSPRMEQKIIELFNRYCDEISPGLFLPKALTPFSGQLFDTPAIERLFVYTPIVIDELTRDNVEFPYDRFLLRLSEYVENGTRMLIDQIEQIDIRKMIEPYAEPIKGGRYFKKMELPRLPNGLKNVLEFDPYQFEIFISKLLEVLGFTSIGLVGRSGDRGVDLVARDPQGILTVIQCKRYFQHNVSSTPVQRLHSYAITRKANRKILITTSGFTQQAKQEAEITGTELIDGEKLEIMIAKNLPDYFD